MKKVLCFLSMAVMFFVIPTQASAIIVYDTLGPSNSYSIGTGWTLGTPPGFPYSVQGDAFIPTGGNYVLDRIELAVGIVTGANELDVWLMSNSISGKPDTIIESFHFSGQMGPFGSKNPLIIGNSSLNPVLNNGEQYWLISTTTSVAGSWAAWNLNNSGVRDRHALKQNGGTWFSSVDTQGAFRIVGQDSNVIPEPATIFLLSSGVLGLLGVFKKKKIV